MADWFERVTPIIEENATRSAENSEQLAELRKLIERYIRGASNGP